jgi:hypothetical protein
MYACSLLGYVFEQTLTLSVPAVKGRNIALATVFKLICLSHNMAKYLNESV